MIWLVTAALIACLFLAALWVRGYFTMRRLRMDTDDARRRFDANELIIQRITKQLQEIEHRLADGESQLELVSAYAGACVPPSPPRSGLNMSSHGEILRLHQEGLDEFGIAEALHVPVGEVRLLLHLELSHAAPAPAKSRRTTRSAA